MAAPENNTKQQRTLAVKVEIRWDDPASKALYKRLQELGWQSARYFNSHMRRKWAEAANLRVDPKAGDPHDVTKQGRKNGEKGELGSAAYAAIEREAQGSWTRDFARIMSGAPLPERSPNSALAIRGHKNKKESGVTLEIEGGQYVAYLKAENKDCPTGTALRLPIAKNTRRDEYQSPILNGMIAWTIPISKATVQINPEKGRVTLRLSYAIEIPLPKVGARVATFGPLERDGRLHLRTETQTKDYTSRIQNILERKDAWDLQRRRVMSRIGRRKGHARIKRRVLARLSWDNWLETYLHTWSREIAVWCETQGVGEIRVESISTKDWPAYRFVELLKYKAAENGAVVTETAKLDSASSERAVKGAISKQQRAVTKRRRAVRELKHQLEKGA